MVALVLIGFPAFQAIPVSAFPHSLTLLVSSCFRAWGELPGVAVPAPPSSTGMLDGLRHWGILAGRGHLAACLLQRRVPAKSYRVDRSNTRRSGCYTIVSD